MIVGKMDLNFLPLLPVEMPCGYCVPSNFLNLVCFENFIIFLEIIKFVIVFLI